VSDFHRELVQPDPCPGLPEIEIGRWSLEKHELLRRYVIASWAARSKWRSRAFVDLYSGPGRVAVRGTELVTDGGALVAWRAAAGTRAPFTRIFVSDIDGAAAKACESRLKALGAPVSSAVGPADQIVSQLGNRIPARGLHLAYLDPFNLEHLPFSIIESLARFRSIDIVVHFSVMDLQREIELDFDRDASRLEAFAPGWRRSVSVRKRTKAQARHDYMMYWLSLVEGVGFKCSRERPLMTNSNNGPLYRMMFLMRHPLPERLWNEVANDAPRTGQSDLFEG
jgi:three-Cys-motif partner protein